MSGNPLLALEALGQSVWLDYIDRALLASGELARLIREDGVSGVTSNPAIFGKAIARGGYDADIARLARAGRAPAEIYEALTVADVQRAADLLRSVYEASGGRDGYVSLEVSPHLADDMAATVAEAQRLATAVARPNLMVKIPGTRAGLPAIRALLAGPTQTEKERGLRTAIPDGTRLLSLRAATGGVAVVNLTGLPGNDTPVDRVRVITQIARSLIGLSGIERVRLRNEGQPWGLWLMSGGVADTAYGYRELLGLTGVGGAGGPFAALP